MEGFKPGSYEDEAQRLDKALKDHAAARERLANVDEIIEADRMERQRDLEKAQERRRLAEQALLEEEQRRNTELDAKVRALEDQRRELEEKIARLRRGETA